MLFHSSIRKELARTFGATFVVLVSIVISMMLIRSLRLAARGSVSPADVMMVMGYTVLGHMSTILTLSLFVAVVGVLSRMYHDSEMVVWFSSGRGLRSFVAPIFRFAWPILAAILALALVIWPWANQQIDDMRANYEQRGDIDRVAPGQFQEASNGSRVLFIDKDAPDSKTGYNVFVSTFRDGKLTVTSAQRGHLETQGNDRVLVLEHGRNLENWQDPAANKGVALRIADFDRYNILVSQAPLANAAEDRPVRTRSTLDLIENGDRKGHAELSWRLGLAFAGFNFLLIALASTRINPRAGRSLNTIFALLAFVVYYNLITVGQSWIDSGRIGLVPWLVVLHGGMLAFSLGWLYKREFNWSWKDLLPGARRAAAQGGAA
ncbi:MAG: Lipopolysaccharide export system permease protein LptF [Paracidovorax wautersii]|uniref:Lipopolysaccharide export system permease protein LptF n=1 Tax=Paracidovorax wautersii TaxID=1177982 RepID=A0A7V8FQ26_9BURK|nr:MAG: Lipopolysaccharide export system permease protein LptF [Paracidovorax wautersii]